MREPRGPEWPQTVEDIVNKNEVRQAEHLDRVALLEDGYGIPIDELRKIYGDTILNRFDPNAEVIERWLKLCETLRGTEKSMVALVGTKTELEDGCSFSRNRRELAKSDIIIVTNPHDAAISFQEDDRTTWALMDAQGFQLLQPYMRDEQVFDDLTEEPKAIQAYIAVRGKSAWSGPAYDTLSVIAAGDDFTELYNAVEDAFVEAGGIYGYEQRILDPALSRLSSAWWQIAKKARLAAATNIEA